MKDQKIRLDQIDYNYKFDLAFQEIENTLEAKLWEIFDKEKNRRFSKHNGLIKKQQEQFS